MQSHSSAAPQPVCIEIDVVAKTLETNPPIKQRLEQKAQEAMDQKSQLTLEKINEKLEKAGERKAKAIISHISQYRETTERVIVNREYKNSKERAQGIQLIDELGFKQATAEANRTVQLDQIRAKARKANDRVLINQERKTSQERAQEERVQEVLTQKLTTAEERLIQSMKQVQEKAKVHNELASQRAIHHKEEKMKQLDDAKSQIVSKMTRIPRMHEQAHQKAKNFNERVQARIETLTSTQAVQADSLKEKIEDKLQSAAQRREQHIEKLKTTAAQSSTPRLTNQQQSAEQQQE